MQIKILNRRSDFVKISKEGAKVFAPSFILLVKDGFDDGAVHVGYTVTKKVGCAVERNRIKRRFREVVRKGMLALGMPGKAYVLIANKKAMTRNFVELCQDFSEAMARANKAKS